MTRELLLEIGAEEIPAKFMPGTLEQAKELAEKLLREKRIGFSEVTTYGTPRRIVVHVTGVAERQKDLTSEAKGPSKKVAFDADGKPTKAAQGFARSQGVAVEDLFVKNVDGVEYLFARRVEEGQVTAKLLPEIFMQLILGLSFPKPMAWGDKNLRFARPIRWLLALYDHEVVPLELEGIISGRITYGHRFLSKGPITIDSPQDYFAKLEAAYVVVDQNRRREMIRQQVVTQAAKHGGKAMIEPELLEEVNYLVEYPTALVGSFASEYLEVPQEVLITSMQENQRYFPVTDAAGKLMPLFITIRNGNDAYLDIVREGNEKVLRARLADAKFFYDEDQRIPLAEYVKRLKNITFQEKLGSVYDKVMRDLELTNWLAEKLAYSKEDRETVARVAYLAKADLVTSMVYEFPELQGIMGRTYALLSGEGEAVAQGIYEHYLPRFSGDALPASPAGRAVSMADKMDTIVGCFGVGLIPTGSQDPYALRRQAMGIVLTILDGKLTLSLAQFIEQAMSCYGFTGDEIKAKVIDFFAQRVRNVLSEQGIRYDVNDAILAVGCDDIYGTWLRAQALTAFREKPEFTKLLAAFNRVINLAKKGEHEVVKEELFTVDAERNLYQAYLQVEAQVAKLVEDYAYNELLNLLATLEEPVNHFFDQVMVMVEDTAVRDNRLALLRKLAGLFTNIGDLSKLVVA